MPEDSRQAGAGAIFVSRELLDEASALLFLYDPEQHHPADYALTIVSSILGHRPFRRDGDIAYISLDSSPLAAS